MIDFAIKPGAVLRATSFCSLRLNIQSQKISKMVDKITEINIKDLPLLRDLYKLDSSDKSKNYTTYITIDTYIRWFQQGLDINCVKFYCLNGNFTRGTFVVVVSLMNILL